jgi:hypothetical protein
MSKYREIRRDPDEVIRPDYADQFAIEDDGIGWVLIVGNDDGDEVKIGWSNRKELRKRYTEYVKAHFFGDSETHLLAAVRGTQQNESDIHAYFHEYQNKQRASRGQMEFFHATDAVVDYLAFLRSLYFTAISLKESETERCFQPMSFDLWKPSQTHVKKERAEVDLFTKYVPWSCLPDRSISTIMDDFYTPTEILDCARSALGGVIDLDPASHVVANEVVKARVFFSEREDGLMQPWRGRVWLNPPFSKSKSFSQKIACELQRGQIERMVVLANSRTITARYFEPVMRAADAVCVLHGRYSFWGNEKDGSPSNGQVMLYFSIDHSWVEFSEAFRNIGMTFYSEFND